jgi:hypothetical protein
MTYEELREIADKLFARVGPLHLTLEEIQRMGKVEDAGDARLVQVILEVLAFNKVYETRP